MFIYMYRDIQQLTNNYHSNGGAIVIAESLEQTIKLLHEVDAWPTEEEQKAVIILGHAIDATTYNRVYKFPNAGCC